MENIMFMGFILTVGAMIVLISLASFLFMIFYQVKNKSKVDGYIKRMIFIGLILGMAIVFVSYKNLDLSVFGF